MKVVVPSQFKKDETVAGEQEDHDRNDTVVLGQGC